MENQYAAVQEQEEQILADYGDQDESDGDVELNDISFSCAGSPRISIIDGEVGDSQPIVRRDRLVELANEERRFEFREDLENNDWRVHIRPGGRSWNRSSKSKTNRFYPRGSNKPQKLRLKSW